VTIVLVFAALGAGADACSADAGAAALGTTGALARSPHPVQQAHHGEAGQPAPELQARRHERRSGVCRRHLCLPPKLAARIGKGGAPCKAANRQPLRATHS
jgi:hypothetical protein